MIRSRPPTLVRAAVGHDRHRAVVDAGRNGLEACRFGKLDHPFGARLGRAEWWEPRRRACPLQLACQPVAEIAREPHSAAALTLYALASTLEFERAGYLFKLVKLRSVAGLIVAAIAGYLYAEGQYR